MNGKLDHVALAVRDIDDAAEAYANFGMSISSRHIVEQQGVEVAFLPAGNAEDNVSIELLEPLSDNSTVAKFLERRGEGLHHICFEVEDIEATLSELAAKGVELIDRSPRAGAEGRVAFVHPRSGKGVLIELLERWKR